MAFKDVGNFEFGFLNPEEILLKGVKASSVLGNISQITANDIYVPIGPEFSM